jgi:hypothetical protein
MRVAQRAAAATACPRYDGDTVGRRRAWEHAAHTYAARGRALCPRADPERCRNASAAGGLVQH